MGFRGFFVFVFVFRFFLGVCVGGGGGVFFVLFLFLFDEFIRDSIQYLIRFLLFVCFSWRVFLPCLCLMLSRFSSLFVLDFVCFHSLPIDTSNQINKLVWDDQGPLRRSNQTICQP